MREDDIQDLIALLYAGVTDRSRLLEFLARLAERTNAHTGVIQIHDISHAVGELVVSVGAITMGSSEMRSYNDRFAEENVWVQHGTQLLLRNGTVTGTEIINQRALMKTPFYHDFLRPISIHDSLAALLWFGESGGVAMLTLNCSKRQGIFGSPEQRLLQCLLPHLQNAYLLQRRLSWIDGECRSLHAALDRLRFGMLLVDANGVVRSINSAAAAMLDGKVDSGTALARLPGIESSCRQRLQAIACCAVADENVSSPVSTRLVLRRQEPDRPDLLAVVSTLHRSLFADFDATDARAVVFLHPLTQCAKSTESEDWLADAYSLTPSQVKLTRLICQGLDLQQCAQHLSIRLHTVRTQLKMIYAKTGVRRQAELVALLSALLGV